jgi:HJR/Mrr/RecB family endonuclease
MVSRFLQKAAKNLVKEAIKEIQKTLLDTFKDIILGQATLDRKELGQLVAQIDQMTGEEFEEFLSICFKRLGYVVKTTPKSNDFGADLILSKQGNKTVVQAKRYQKTVGSGAVQEVVYLIRLQSAINTME